MDPPLVLYIDDEPGLLELTKVFLEEGGDVRVETEQRSYNALSRLSQAAYDVIVSDYQMPRMNGIELLKELRKRGDPIPFILFTGRGREEVAIEALNSGADFYIQKGGNLQVQFGELKNAIVQLAQRRRAELQVTASEQKYRDLVEGANSIILKLDPDGRITFLNQYGLDFFDCVDDIVGRPVVGTLIRPEDHSEAEMEEMVRAFTTGACKQSAFTLLIRRRNGTRRWTSWTAKTIRGEGNRVKEVLVIGNDVTAAKDAEQDLQRSMSHLRAMLDSNEEGILLVDDQGAVVQYNRRLLEMWRIPDPAESRLDRKMLEYVRDQLRDPDAFKQCIEAPCDDLLADDSRHLEFKDGRVFDEHSVPVSIGPNVIGRLLFFRDATGMKDQGRDPPSVGPEPNGALEASPAVMLFIEPGTGKIIHANEAACSFYGYDLERFTDMNIFQVSLLPPTTINDMLRPDELENVHHHTSKHRLATGEIKDVETFTGSIAFNGRNLLFSIVKDITEISKAKRLFDELEYRHDSVLDLIGEGILVVDAQDRIVFANQRLESILRLPSDKIIGTHLLSHIARGSIEDAMVNMRKRREGYTNRADYRMNRGDGSELWAILSAKPFFQRGEFAGTTYAVTDISERREMEERLRESEQKCRQMIDNAQEGIWAVDREWNTTFVNDNMVNMMGYTKDEIIGRSALKFLDEGSKRMLLEHMKDTGTKAAQRGEVVFLRKGGSRLHACLTVSMIVDEEGDFMGAVAFIADITEQKTLQESLWEANKKLSLLNDLTRHDINNQLTALNANLALLRVRTDEPECLARLKAIDLCAESIWRHIEFARIYQELGTRSPQWQGLGPLLDATVLENRDIVNLDITDQVRKVQVYADPMLGKVFHNLLENSAKYARRPTTVRLRCQMCEDHLLLTYEDIGPGISSEKKEKIFESGYGRGTGFGLFLSREVLALTGMSIRETGRPGEGARFDLIIPRGRYRLEGSDATGPEDLQAIEVCTNASAAPVSYSDIVQ
ncbi:MAG: PAS domain S-box protein [Methanomassiliicoccus sp.]|nr:PAS domain S-box protein [Methanomassiliicoccus sp.]